MIDATRIKEDIPVLVKPETIGIILIPVNQMNQVLANVICEFCDQLQELVDHLVHDRNPLTLEYRLCLFFSQRPHLVVGTIGV